MPIGVNLDKVNLLNISLQTKIIHADRRNRSSGFNGSPVQRVGVYPASVNLPAGIGANLWIRPGLIRKKKLVGPDAPGKLRI